jgi:predicted dehydrogenase
MLSSCDLDLVSVCVPNRMHAETVDMALEAGINVLCEKPLALSYREAKRLFEKAEQKELMLETCQTIRFNAE